MKPITPLEVLPVTTYDRVRPLLRPLCIAEKARRRLAVGPHLTLMFENLKFLIVGMPSSPATGA